MEVIEQKAMQTKWIYSLFSIGIAIFFLDNWMGRYCFSKDWINDSMLSWSIFLGVILVSIFYIVLERFNFMVIDNALNDKSSPKKLTSFTVFSYVFCIFLFGSMFVGGMINTGIDLAILISAKNPTEFKVQVSDVDTTPHGGRGSCHGIKYTFHNPPVNRDTQVCDTTDSLAFLKTGDFLFVREEVGSVGVHFISGHYASS